MNWRTVDLSEVVNIKTGKLDSNAAVTGGRYPFFTCSQETFWTNTFSFDAECVLLAGNNANGIFPLKYFHGKFDAYQRTYVLTSRHPDLLIPRFLYYALRPRLSELRGIATGAATKFLTLPIIYRTKIQVSSLPTQHRIVSILSAYDDLIEVNRRRMAILEQMARRLFEEWFVHLRFPGHETISVNDTSNGPLPEGWHCRPLGQLVTEERDIVLPTDLDGATMYVGLEHIPRRSTTLTDWGKAEEVVSAKLRFRPGDILFGKIRPYFHKVAVAPAHGVSSTDTIILRSRAPQHAGIVAAVAASDAFVAHAVQTSNGTKMPRANWSVLARYPVRLPPEQLLAQFNAFVVNGTKHAISLASANGRLAAARDLLLPRLVSGELPVAEAPKPDRLMEAAD